VSPRERRIRGEEGVREIAFQALSLLRARRAHEIRVRVSNPDGGRAGRTVLEVTLADIPFLVDTFRLAIRRLGLREMLLLHPLLRIERANDGSVRRFGEEAETGTLESYLYAETPLIKDHYTRKAIESTLRRVFSETHDAVADYGRMVRAIREHTAEIEFFAARAHPKAERGRRVMGLLNWLADDNFVFFGYRRYRAERERNEWVYQVDPTSGLGILREAKDSRFLNPVRGENIPATTRSRLEHERMIFFDKSRTDSTIHRHGRLDCITITTFDEEGQPTGFGKFIGLLTHKAVRTRGSEIPVISYRLKQVLDAIGAQPRSHNHKAAIEAFDSLPVEFLFSFDVEELTRAVRHVLTASEEQQVKVYVVSDQLSRSYFVSVILPRPAYDETLRRDLERLLRSRYRATYVDHRSSFLDDDVALIHFFCSSGSDVAPDMLEDLERTVEARVARWEDRFESELLEHHPARVAYALADDYAAAFPEAYRLATPAAEAVRDVACLERLRGGEAEVDVTLSKERDDVDPGDEPPTSRLKVFHRSRPFLSDLLPVLDQFGLCVIDATLTEVQCGRASPLWIVTFRIARPAEGARYPKDLERRLLEGLLQTLRGRVEGDALDRLIRGAGLEWREVDLIRAHLSYARQLGTAPELGFASATLLAHPEATRAAISLFRARFDPELEGSRARAERSALAALRRQREPIPTSAEDRVFGLLQNLIECTWRTNFYCEAEDGAHEIALKLDPSRIDDAPRPAPFAEIFVHSVEMSGVHLRGGRVARGGIRWSDRVQDFRTEILGLMKTQMVKNGLIVPVGSKGGFVLKRRPADPDAARAEADRLYARFVRLMLRLTDNLKGDEVIGPERVVAHDGDDTYLAVAADKGTAHLSDVANRVAEEEGFWLGDAFASGGSSGYDHKKQGITARGAWTCVKRHFLELGVDLDEEPFTIAGIGDMSGDVFGNGMLLARKGRLVAAFDHQHIFVDPDPDPEIAWTERKRLFDLPGSSWLDYDRDKLSVGGGVYERGARSIQLSGPAREVLRIEKTRVTGEDLVRAILSAPVDLLWLGGIGTYVKASHESQAEVGDRANERVRIDASQLRARVVGEGANLGLTQLARVEYALAGGCINTDAVDNSGGVDLSDHEVNLKILLNPRWESSEVSRQERDEILRSCVDAACEAVLAHSAAQSRCISMDRMRSEQHPERFIQSAVFLARCAGLDWRLERLPEREELRARSGPPRRSMGYTRPELATLLGYMKMVVQRSLVDSEVLERELMGPVLASYFPQVLRSRFSEEIHGHRLQREITASCLTNRVIDHAGITLVPELTSAAGVSISDVVVAYYAADQLLEARRLRRVLQAQRAPALARLRAAILIEDAVRAAARSWLALGPSPCPELDELEHWGARLRAVREVLPESLDEVDARRVQRKREQLVESGMGRDFAAEIAYLQPLVRTFGAISVAIERDAVLTEVLAAHTRVGVATRVAWLLDRLEALRRHDDWERVAAEALSIEMIEVQRTLTRRELDAKSPEGSPAPARASLPDILRGVDQTAQQIEADERGGLAPLTVLSQQIRRLC
jgi:glutamate dehydrogenase